MRSSAKKLRDKQYRAEHAENIRAYQEKYRAAHKNEAKLYAQKYYQENKERFRTYGVKQRVEKPAQVRAHKRRWARANAGVVNYLTARRRVWIKKATPTWANHFFIAEAYALAALRTKITGIPWHVDHVVPLRGRNVCGLHVESNLRVVPGVENMKKSNTYTPK